jgi:invasion protein IalB
MTCTVMQSPPRNAVSRVSEEISAGRSGDGKIHIHFQVPANIWFEGGVLLFLESSERLLAAPFQFCSGGWCTADAELTAVDIEKLRSQTKPAQMTYRLAPGTKVTLPVSFVGFGDALGGVK